VPAVRIESNSGEKPFAPKNEAAAINLYLGSVKMLRTENLSQDVINAQVASNALVKLIRKLRWMGMDDEAEGVQMTVLSLEALPLDSVVAGPRDTD
jgi:hypothetical protein